MQLRTVNNVFKAAKLPIELVKGKDYFYFVFDDGKRYDTYSIMTPRLNDLSLDEWVKEGKEWAAILMGNRDA